MNPKSKTNFKTFLGLIIFFAISLAVFSPRPASAAMYLPGETLEPACAPTALNCGVVSNISAYFTATSTTQASTFPYASSTALTVSGNSYLGTVSSGTWNGALLSVPYGGTGWASIQSGTIPYGNGTSALSTTTSGTAGNVLALLNGIPTWTATTTLANISGTLPVASGGTGQTSWTSGSVLYSPDGTSLSGTTTANLKSTLALNNVENTALSTWTGTTNITTLGTIATGVWSGTAIAVNKGGTGQTSFGQGWLHSDGTTFTASTSPTVAYLTATSTTATSTFPLLKASTAFQLGSDYIIDITGTNLSITDGVLSAAGASGGSDSKWATSTDTTSIYLNSATKVGIGTSSPLTTLHVNGPVMSSALVLTSSSTALSTLTSFGGFNGYINASGGFGTGGSDSVLNASRLTAYGNLTNIGSVQGGELNLTRGGTFAGKVDYTTNDQPQSVAIGDLNGDGKPDLAVAKYSTGSPSGLVSVFISNGNGTFATKVDYATGGVSYSVAIGDLNGDGKPDLAVTNYGVNSASVFINNGNGTFAAKVDYTTGTSPYSVAIGDLNGDGKPDLAVTNYGVNSASVFINNGNGTFATKVDYAVSTQPIFVAIGDLNGDGKADLAVANWNANSVSVLINNGSGTFVGTRVDYSAGSHPGSIAIGDLDGDGKADLAVANYTSASASILINNGSGTFASKVDYTTGTGPFSVAIGDLNGDGKPDLATANNGASSASILVNNNSGTFATKVDYSAGNGPNSVATGDLNGDGKPDLVVVNLTSGTISVLLNTPTTMLFAQASTGNIVIGTTSPWSKLSIQDTYGSLTPLLDIASSTSAAYATTSIFRVNANGNIGIGTTTPWRTLSVTGTMSATALTAGAAGDFAVCINNTTKEITNAGATGCVVSSKRFKENISALDSGLDELMQLKPSKFAYIGKTGEHIGLIAEDVDAIDKRLVEYEADGITPRTVRYMEISALLIKSIQEQQASIDQIKQTIASTTATSTQSTGLISQGFQWLVDQFSSISGVFLSKDQLQVKKFAAEEFEMSDSMTGDVYCVRMTNGDWKESKGACVTVDIPVSNNVGQENNPPSQNSSSSSSSSLDIYIGTSTSSLSSNQAASSSEQSSSNSAISENTISSSSSNSSSEQSQR